MGATDAARPVAGQLEARFLAQVLDAFTDPGRPIGLGLVFQGDRAGSRGRRREQNLVQGLAQPSTRCAAPVRGRRGPRRRRHRVPPRSGPVGAEQPGGVGA